jgi:RimJ/RimL family protein N-acetyltransferase
VGRPGQTDTSLEAVIETERLMLRRLTAGDAEAIFEVIGDPVAMQYYPQPYTREDAVIWVERNLRRYQEYGYGIFAMVLKSSGEVIGDCGLARQMVEGESMLEVGYHLQRLHWGRGYATEAARGCMDYAFTELGAEEVVSLIRPQNLPSRRVAERNGMQVVREVSFGELPHLLYAMRREKYGQA